MLEAQAPHAGHTDGDPYLGYVISELPRDARDAIEDAIGPLERAAEGSHPDLPVAAARPRVPRYALPALGTVAAAALALLMIGRGDPSASGAAISAKRAAQAITLPPPAPPASPAPIAKPVVAPTPAPVAVTKPVHVEAKPVHVETKPAETQPLELRPLATGDSALLTQYQRVGRTLMKLEAQRGEFACKDLRDEFKAIKIDAAMATAETRTEAAEALTELATRLDRNKGIQVSQDCLNNPLAADCQ